MRKIKNKKEYPNKFPGFSPIGEIGTFWRYPNILDQYWSQLSLTEHKTLDYILRRTFGFNKVKDKVSVSQFVKGIKGCDKGIGVSESAVKNALKSLKQKNFIEIKKTTKNNGGNDTNEYRLVMIKKKKGDIKNTESGIRKTLPNGSRKTGTIKSLKINSEIDRNIREIYSYYREKINSGTRLTNGAKMKIAKCLEIFTPEELKKAISNFSKDEWWMDKHSNRGIFWFFRFEDRVEQFINMDPVGYFNENDKYEK